MRTIIIISIGLVLALVSLVVGHRSRLGTRRAAVWFSLLWTIAMIANLGLGVSHGYSLAEELPILLINVLPAVVVASVGVHLIGRRAPGARDE